MWASMFEQWCNQAIRRARQFASIRDCANVINTNHSTQAQSTQNCGILSVTRYIHSMWSVWPAWAEHLAAWRLHLRRKLAHIVSSRVEAARVEIERARALLVAASHSLGILPHNLHAMNKVNCTGTGSIPLYFRGTHLEPIKFASVSKFCA